MMQKPLDLNDKTVTINLKDILILNEAPYSSQFVQRFESELLTIRTKYL